MDFHGRCAQIREPVETGLVRAGEAIRLRDVAVPEVSGPPAIRRRRGALVADGPARP